MATELLSRQSGLHRVPANWEGGRGDGRLGTSRRVRNRSTKGNKRAAREVGRPYEGTAQLLPDWATSLTSPIAADRRFG